MVKALEVQSVLHINEKGGRFGGTEEYIASLTGSLLRVGVRSHLIYDHGGDDLVSGMASTARVEGLGDRLLKRDLTDAIHRIVDQVSPDVIYVHNIFHDDVMHALDTAERSYSILWYIHDHYPTCLTELRTLALEGGRTVCRRLLSDHCLPSIHSGQCVKRHATRSFGQRDLNSRIDLLESARRADAIIVVSAFMKDVMVEHLPEIAGKIHCLPRQVKPPSAVRAKRHEPPYVVAYSGRICEEKGLHIALQAVSGVSVDGAVLFRIAGPIEDPDYWAHCRDLARKAKLANSRLTVRYEGHLEYDQVNALYAQADIIVFPSVWAEPLGVVAAEALVHGAAVIASDLGGISTWIKHEETGLLADPNRVETFTEALTRLLHDQELRQTLAASGQRLITAEYTDDAHLRALFDVIWRSA